ncbi:MFS transporter [Nakamurella silvestris]|nr:MFS transporter [Nakamurella silvestris]
MPVGLIALALGGFGIGLTEFVIAGLLTDVAADLGVTIPVAGYLVSGYALAVVFGALFLTAASTRLPAKTALLGLMVLFIIGNLLSALSPNYAVMMAGRVVAALAHGAFFGIGAVLATNLVAPEKKAGAISIMFAGLTSANVLGVPLGTFLGQQFGWRSTFWAITAIGIIAFVGIAALVPAADPSAEQATGNLRAELRAFRRPQVWFSIAMTVLVFGGMFGAFIYIEPLLTQVSGFGTGAVPWLLVLFGVGLFVGNMLGGKLADRALAPTLIALMAGLTVVMVLFAVFAHVPFLAATGLLLMGFFGFATVPGLQMRVLGYASDAPTMASSANIAAFNLGNTLGVYLGGLTIAAGLGFVSPLVVGSLLSGAGLVVMLVATSRARRSDAAERGVSEAIVAS